MASGGARPCCVYPGSRRANATNDTPTSARPVKAVPTADGRSVQLTLSQVVEDHIHDFDLSGIRSQAGRRLVHTKAYYTVNEIPKN